MDLVLFGIQGSGKGTQARLLAERYNMRIFEMGGELREYAKKDTDLGRKIKETLQKGHHVDSEIIFDILNDFLDQHPAEEGIIFDGVPRNHEQEDKFKGIVKKHNRKFIAVNLVMDEERTIKRLLKRAEIENRSDDTYDTIKKRIEIFHQKTQPVIDHYRSQGLVIDVNGDQSIEDVNQAIVSKMQTYLIN